MCNLFWDILLLSVVYDIFNGILFDGIVVAVTFFFVFGCVLNFFFGSKINESFESWHAFWLNYDAYLKQLYSYHSKHELKKTCY